MTPNTAGSPGISTGPSSNPGTSSGTSGGTSDVLGDSAVTGGTSGPSPGPPAPPNGTAGAPGAADGGQEASAARPSLLRTVAAARALARPEGARAVVMTMGALHAGHAALVRAARERVGPEGQVVVTVFVNPLQFGPGEDLDRYPRTLDADVELAGREGADVVFAPAAREVYPEGVPRVTLAAGTMGERLEGASRPGHFDGMLTVVAKLLHLTAPDLAFFGEKDAQQLALISRMVRDLDFPVEIVGVPTVREPDGLALSSRNGYLSEAERVSARALSRALFAAGERAGEGPRAVLETARAVLRGAAAAQPPVTTDYVALVDPSDFTELTETTGGPRPAVLAVAARVGSVRLIDNVRLTLGRSDTAGANEPQRAGR
ncbi:pantoate--beta-alanine ligase [Streptomyces sp. AJS327]|uniref:pantoate--beta-alanine ligase n=1 Tax=Streptomyces sp. AJS327 TaxID=2545265 RepID=UPI0015DEAA48|nr:pantoate--beta-alanine ligase [Streptomyces sp. AJS327]MBA0053081.1 pantoate--beta-alanine ligase [Streptomyces sp. AJS327]